MDIDLSTDAPASPARTRQLAEAFAEIARVLNHTTMHREALEVPSDADGVLRDAASAAARLPQLCSQVARWVAAEDAAGRIGVPSGEWAGRPHTAVTALQVRLDAARASAASLCADLEYAAQVTSDLAGPDPEDGLLAGCGRCRAATRSVPCPRCGGPACAVCGRCPPCDGDLPDDEEE